MVSSSGGSSRQFIATGEHLHHITTPSPQMHTLSTEKWQQFSCRHYKNIQGLSEAYNRHVQGIGRALALLPKQEAAEIIIASHGALSAAVKLGNELIAEVHVATEGQHGSLVLGERLAEGPATTARAALLLYLEARTTP